MTAVFRSLWDRYGRVFESGYPVPLSVLALYRIALGSYMLILNAVPDMRWISAYPAVFYDPAPGLPAMWGGFLPYWALVGFEIALIGAICGMLVGWRTKQMSIAVTVIGYLANSAYFTFGKIDHTFMLWIVPVFMAFSGWGRLYSVDAVRAASAGRGGRAPADPAERGPSWPIVCIGAFLGHAFLTAALPKALRGWLSFDNSAVKRHFLQLNYQLERDELLAGAFLDFDFQPFWEALDWAGVGLELALAFSLLWPFWHRWLILAAWLFHVANLLLLNISFYGPLAVYPLFFLPLISPQLGARVGDFIMANRRVALALVPVLAVVAFVWQGLWWTVTQNVLGMSPRWSDLLFFVSGLVILLAVGIKSRGYRRVIGANLT